MLPLGSGGFPASPGSQNEPVWRSGTFALALSPKVGFDGQLWMFAQTLAYFSQTGCPGHRQQKTDWDERIYTSMVSFKGKFWLYGGLAYDARIFLNDIWNSTDGLTWTKVGTAGWSPRGAHTVVAFHDRLWLFGGADQIDANRGTSHFLNDVWVSDDGLSWTLVTPAAAWTPRNYPAVLVLKDDLFLVGSNGHADVWRSSDGAIWSLLASEASWKPRHDYGHVVLADRLWVFGGWASNITNALNDVWYSEDGVTWQRQAEHAPWAPRGPISVVFKDQIWIYSGQHRGAEDNWGGDAWRMVSAVPSPK